MYIKAINFFRTPVRAKKALHPNAIFILDYNNLLVVNETFFYYALIYLFKIWKDCSTCIIEQIIVLKGRFFNIPVLNLQSIFLFPFSLLQVAEYYMC